MMTLRMLLSIFFIVHFYSIGAQEEILYITPSDFDQFDRISISNSDNWQFTIDNDVQWIKDDLGASTWTKKGPTNFSKTLGANEDIEGWFKLRFQLDEAFDTIPIMLNVSNFGQALEVFIDDRLIHTIGNLGNNGTEYKRGTRPNLYDLIPIKISTKDIHVLAIHYKNESISFPASLFTNKESLYFRCSITGPNYAAKSASLNIWNLSSGLFSSSVIFVILLLFLMFLLQNPTNGLLRLLIICIFGFLLLYVSNLLKLEGLINSIETFTIFDGLSDLAFCLILPTLPLVFAKIFTNKLPKQAWLSIPFFAFCLFEYRILRYDPLGVLLLLISFSICVTYVVRSRHNLKGAQWYVVAGGLVFLISAISIFIVLINNIYIKSTIIFWILPLVFPLSLLGFVVSRFKEVENEVRVNADRIIQITYEKHQLALNQKVELEKQVKSRTAELSESLENLKSTQNQLIQSEKMASLGELTAGIAHEIQNPLNFVNNFSEVSNELIDEVNEELDKGDIEEVKFILGDIKGNLEKINHHGKRADAIVKGMLQHSRTSSGQKVLTDINALCDEYLRLSYHGQRGKDNKFNSEFVTEFDPDLPKVNVIPHDIGRVLLNLINNAFYAVNERSKKEVESYKPAVSISTKKSGDKIQISVTDNGPGIPDAIKDKIFQPFFTTKDTGKGTGLGLSLAYDIVKAHGGEMRVESPPTIEAGPPAGVAGNETYGSEFIIKIPIVS
jgi:signal transduction histidine kinase